MVDVSKFGSKIAPYVDDVAIAGVRMAGLDKQKNINFMPQDVNAPGLTTQHAMQGASPMAMQQALQGQHMGVPQSIANAPADMSQDIHDKAAELAAQAHHECYKRCHKHEVGEDLAVCKAVEPVQNVANTATDISFMGLMASEIALPAVGAAAGFFNLSRTKELLNKPYNYLNPTGVPEGKLTLGGKINNGLMLASSGLATYGTARTFLQQLNGLKNMYSDVTGIPVENVSTMTILSGKVPEVVREARSHFLKEYVGRGALNALGLGVVARKMMQGKPIGMIEGLAPVAAVPAVESSRVFPYGSGARGRGSVNGLAA